MTGKHRAKLSSRSVRRVVTRRLVKECKILQSRISSLLGCENAIRTLTSEDVFGGRYERLLRQDVRCLERAIKVGERELNETVEL